MFDPHYHIPNEELLTSHMKDLVLANVPAGTFGTVAALLVPYTDHPIYEAVLSIAHLGEGHRNDLK